MSAAVQAAHAPALQWLRLVYLHLGHPAPVLALAALMLGLRLFSANPMSRRFADSALQVFAAVTACALLSLLGGAGAGTAKFGLVTILSACGAASWAIGNSGLAGDARGHRYHRFFSGSEWDFLPTPPLAWRIVSVLCWLGAALGLLFMSADS